MQKAASYRDLVAKHGLDYKEHQAECVEWCLRQEQSSTLAGGVSPNYGASGVSPHWGRNPDNETVVRGRNPEPHGGLIADEMGLGKTIQIIALIHANPLPTTLIVVPVALLAQWHEALTQFQPKDGTQTIIYYHGPSRKKHTPPPPAPSSTYTFRPRQNHSIIALTTYGEISRPQSRTDRTPASQIHSQEWSRVVFDEAHHLRTPKTNVHQAALQLSSNIKWLLTGTPIQNSRTDFYALCAIIGVPKSLYMGENLNIKALTTHYMIKRTKKQLQIPMPELKEQVVYVDWKDDCERELSMELHNRIGMITTESSFQKSIKIPNFNNRLNYYLRARQLCVLPSLIKDPIITAFTTGQDQDQDQDQDQFNREQTLDFLQKATSASSKLTEVIKHVLRTMEEAPTRRKLIFCEFHKEIAFIKKSLIAHGIICEQIDGRTTRDLKDAIISSPHIQVLLLQIKTCGEGLNLQQYSDIYLVTPQWNPAIEEQAICRAYRIGQHKQVNVYKFIMTQHLMEFGNIEARVLEKQNVKRETALQLN